MKIAQIAPLIESVPPRFYGGTERVVWYLTEELVRLGHDVTLFASGDSVTSARLVSCARTALRLDRNVRDPIPYYMLMLDRLRECAEDFDILHFHIDQFQFPLFRPLASRTLTTLHGRQDLPDLRPLYFGFNEMPLVSISDGQRAPILTPISSPPSTMGCRSIFTRRRSIRVATMWPSSVAFHRRRALIARSRLRRRLASRSGSRPKWIGRTRPISASRSLLC
jgi:glycosyltransferase involved in cell wall biosynthesis